MTRGLHVETKVQRASDPGKISKEDRERGYEKTDAPAGKVALGIAGFAGLALFGLGFAALAGLWIGPPNGLQDVQVKPQQWHDLSEPSLLVRPVVKRKALEQRHSPDKAALEAAMNQAEARGWEEGNAP